nr:urocanate hydratase-like [Microcebus murinus]
MPVSPHPSPTCRTKAAAAIMHMIMNNLDPEVAQPVFPTPPLCRPPQFRLTMSYLAKMTEEQTLVMYSGHPLGLFPSSPSAPRLVVTNGMVVPNYSSKEEYEKLFALGVTMYGQMTAGSYCYIGPQGIVHGTVLTVLNAARRYLAVEDLAGKVFVTSGLGGMSGAQAKAAVIVGCVGVIAEVDKAALDKRHKQGWLMEVTDSLDRCIERLREARSKKEVLSLGYHGNVVALWERLAHILATTGELLVDLGSDQTSCHNPFRGGYYPVQLGFEEAQSLMASDPASFRSLVQESLRRQVTAINRLARDGCFFWDYGNAFLLEARRAGADVGKTGAGKTDFRYPSYVQDIMGDIFSQGFGPFRWVCTSGDPRDLAVTDRLAATVLEEAIAGGGPASTRLQYKDNLRWIREAAKHQLVRSIHVYFLLPPGARPGQPERGVQAVASVSPDMAVQNFVGDAFRGATWVALHNGGGVGWSLGVRWWQVARRCWSGNRKAHETIRRTMEDDSRLEVTLPHEVADDGVIWRALRP